MRGLNRATLVVFFAVALTGVTCAFPTDKSDKVVVTLEAPSRVVLRGETVSVFARAFRVIGTDTQAIGNIDFVFSSGSSTIARVEKDCCGYATVTGVNSGTVDIIARAVAFEGAQTAYLSLRVSNPLEVDSVVPDTVRYGSKVRIYGVGIPDLFLASIGVGALIPDTFTVVQDSGFSSMEFWVPPPSQTGELVILGPGVFSVVPETTVVRPFDIFEPNNTSPWPINLELPGPFPQIPGVLLYNPALAFERLPRDQTQGSDWYRFSQGQTRDVSLIVTAREASGTFVTFLTDSLTFTPPDQFLIGPDSWTFGPGSHACHGAAFEPPQLPSDSTVIALRGMPPGTLDAVSIYGVEAPYAMAVVAGYVTSPKVSADPHEEDDFCNAADAKAMQPPELRGLFTIDNPGDVDWFRFNVPGATPASIRFRLEAAAAAALDTLADIDLYVAQVPSGQATLPIVGSSVNARSLEDTTFVLAPGDYYLIVVDYAAVPLPYAMCYGSVVFCSGPLPGASVDGVSRRAPKASRPVPAFALRLSSVRR